MGVLHSFWSIGSVIADRLAEISGEVVENTVSGLRKTGGCCISLILAFALVLTPSLSAAQQAGPEPTLEALVAEAAVAYPDLLSRWAEVDALRAREEQVSQPFDPMVGLGIMNVPISSFAFTEHGMTGIQVGARQRFYWPGTLDARAEAARAVAEARQAGIPERVIRLWMEAVRPYYQIRAFDRAFGVLEQQLDAFSALRDGARGRYEAGVVPLTDVLRVDTEINRVRELIVEIERNRRTAVATLNGLLNRPTQTPIETRLLPRDHTPSTETRQQWTELAIQRRPAFEALAARRSAIASGIRAAEAGAMPMWEVGLAYSLRFQEPPLGNDLVSLSFGINLPFFSRARSEAQVDELAARSLAVDYDQDELVRQLEAQVAAHLESVLGIEAEILVIDDDLIPSINSVYDAAVSHYSSSHTNIEALIQIQIRQLQLELMRARLVSHHDMHSA